MKDNHSTHGGMGYFEKKFFAASNSSSGFHNDFHACLGEGSGVQRLYIIKGGPGTGKSHFMRTIGRYAESKGYHATYYYCSSDPASLDGVRLEKRGNPTLGFVDGTAPHVFEPSVPGVKEEIINLGVFWNPQILRNAADVIGELGSQKSAAYAMAYHYLSASGETQAVADALTTPCMDIPKLTALADRLVRNQPIGQNFKATPAHLRAVGMTGSVYFDTYEKMADAREGEVVYIQDYYGVAFVLMDMIYALAEKKKSHVLISRDPVHTKKIDGIFFDDTALCLLVTQQIAEEEQIPPHRRTINLRRYVNPTILKEMRGQIRHALTLTKTLQKVAIHSLAEVGKHHFELEKIYSSAMDFTAKEAFTKALCRQLFGE